jgi:hypothetical protein
MGVGPNPAPTARVVCPRVQASKFLRAAEKEAGAGIRHQRVHSIGLGQHDNCPVAGHSSFLRYMGQTRCYCVAAYYPSSASTQVHSCDLTAILRANVTPSRPADPGGYRPLDGTHSLLPRTQQYYSRTGPRRRPRPPSHLSSPRLGQDRAALKHRACRRNAIGLQRYWLSGLRAALGHKRLAPDLKQTILGFCTSPLAIFEESQTAKQPPAQSLVAR